MCRWCSPRGRVLRILGVCECRRRWIGWILRHLQRQSLNPCRHPRGRKFGLILAILAPRWHRRAWKKSHFLTNYVIFFRNIFDICPCGNFFVTTENEQIFRKKIFYESLYERLWKFVRFQQLQKNFHKGGKAKSIHWLNSQRIWNLLFILNFLATLIPLYFL